MDFFILSLPRTYNFFYYCRYHPDKNANDPAAAEIFKEVTFSYSILSDPDKRRQFDTAGFEVINISHVLDLVNIILKDDFL